MTLTAASQLHCPYNSRYPLISYTLEILHKPVYTLHPISQPISAGDDGIWKSGLQMLKLRGMGIQAGSQQLLLRYY